MSASKSGDGLALPLVGGGLLMVALIGGYEWLKAHESGAGLTLHFGTTPATSTTPATPATSSTTGGTSSNASSASSAAAVAAGQQAVTAAQLAAQLAATKKQQDIEALRSDLANVWNQMDLMAVQLDTLKRQAYPVGFEQQVLDDLFRDCEAHTAASWLFGGLRCDGVRAQAPAEAAKRWAAQITVQSQPYQAQLSSLAARQSALILNLAQLGYTVPPAMKRSATA